MQCHAARSIPLAIHLREGDTQSWHIQSPQEALPKCDRSTRLICAPPNVNEQCVGSLSEAASLGSALQSGAPSKSPRCGCSYCQMFLP
eukprot:3932032-Rhodomonas_salina.2